MEQFSLQPLTFFSAHRARIIPQVWVNCTSRTNKPSGLCLTLFLGSIQRVQKQLFEAFSINVHSHTNGGVVLAGLGAPALIAFLFDDGKVPGFENYQRVFGKDRGCKWIPKIIPSSLNEIVVLCF